MMVHPLTGSDAYSVSRILRNIDQVEDVDLIGSVEVFRDERHIGWLVLHPDADARFTQEEPAER